MLTLFLLLLPLSIWDLAMDVDYRWWRKWLGEEPRRKLNDLARIFVVGLSLVTPMSCVSDPVVHAPAARSCDYEAQAVRENLRITWARAFSGEALDDRDLQAFADADAILKCVVER